MASSHSYISLGGVELFFKLSLSQILGYSRKACTLRLMKKNNQDFHRNADNPDLPVCAGASASCAFWTIELIFDFRHLLGQHCLPTRSVEYLMSISFRTIRPPKYDLGKGYIFMIVLGFAFGFDFPLRLFAIVWKEAIGWSELSGTSRHLNGHYLGNSGGCD